MRLFRPAQFIPLLLLSFVSLLLALPAGLAQSSPAAKPTAQAASQAASQGTSQASPQAAVPGLGQDFQDFIAEQMKLFHTSGMGLAVVRNDDVLLSKGYGYRDIEHQLPVTSQTVFSIGSITKSFTSSLL